MEHGMRRRRGAPRRLPRLGHPDAGQPGRRRGRRGRGRPGRDGHRAQPRPAARHGLRPAGRRGPNDLVVAVRAADDDAAVRAVAAMEQALAAASAGGSGDGLGGSEPAPRDRALGGPAYRRGRPRAGLGARAARVHRGDGRARVPACPCWCSATTCRSSRRSGSRTRPPRRGLLVMGPDCGTAVVGGVGLGFANAVRPGPVGLVAASGTGAQQLMCLLDTAGVGVSHCLGVGGRDLSAAVGGRSTRAALALLDDDPATELVVLVSKPPDPGGGRARSRRTPSRWRRRCCSPCSAQGQPDLTTRRAAGGRGRRRDLGRAVVLGPAAAAGRRRCAARAVRRRHAVRRGDGDRGRGARRRSASNIPLRPGLGARPATCAADGHLMVDFGDDALTQGRAHPMIDQRTRLDRIAVEAADPTLRGAAARRRARARRAPRPGRRAGAGDRGRRGHRARRRPRRSPWSSRCARPPTTRRTRAGRPRRCTRPAPRCSCPTRPPPGTPSQLVGGDAMSLLDEAPRVVAVGVADVRRRAGRAGRRRSTQVDWRPPLDAGHRAGAGPGAGRPAARAEANATAVGRMLAAGAELVDVARRPRRSAWAATSSCTPGRRSAGTARPARCAAR